MKICPKCQSRYAADKSFCLRDGTPLIAGGIDNQPVTHPLVASVLNTAIKRSGAPGKNYFIYLLIGGFLATIVAGVAVVYFYHSARDVSAAVEVNQRTTPNPVAESTPIAASPIANPSPKPRLNQKVSRLRFAKGAYSTTISADIQQGETQVFTVRAMAGQTFFTEMDSDSRMVTVEIPSPYFNARTNMLEKTTDYQIIVKNTGVETRFSLKVSIY